MVDPVPHIRSAASAPTAPTAALELCRRRCCRSLSFHHRPRHRHRHLHHRHHCHLRDRCHLSDRARRLRHHHRHPRPHYPRARQRSRPDRLNLAGGLSRHRAQLFAGGTHPRGTMRRTSGLTATRRHSHRPTARHQGECTAPPRPSLLVRSPCQEPELRSCRQRAPRSATRPDACACPSLWRGRGASHWAAVRLSSSFSNPSCWMTARTRARSRRRTWTATATSTC